MLSMENASLLAVESMLYPADGPDSASTETITITHGAAAPAQLDGSDVKPGEVTSDAELSHYLDIAAAGVEAFIALATEAPPNGDGAPPVAPPVPPCSSPASSSGVPAEQVQEAGHAAKFVAQTLLQSQELRLRSMVHPLDADILVATDHVGISGTGYARDLRRASTRTKIIAMSSCGIPRKDCRRKKYAAALRVKLEMLAGEA